MLGGGFLPEEPSQGPAAAPRLPPEPAGQRAACAQPAASTQWTVPPPPARGGRAAYTPAGAGMVDPADFPEAQGGCSRCSSLSFNSEWLKAFNVVLCNGCRQGEALISKSTAKQRYGLSDGDLGPLGSLRKPNPHKKDWQPMHLYLESQVARVAHDKYGGEAGLLEHVHAKLDAKLQAKLRRREEEKQREAKEAARLQRIRQRLQEEAAEPGGGGGAVASDTEEI